jgi:hypothetical protein
MLLFARTITSSETLCGDVSNKNAYSFKNLPQNQLDWGAYLAGLVEGDGHFSNQKQIVITFSKKDYVLALTLQKTLGYGNVNKIKGKNAYNWIISDTLYALTVVKA